MLVKNNANLNRVSNMTSLGRTRYQRAVYHDKVSRERSFGLGAKALDGR